MSRKTLLFIVAVIGGVFGVLKPIFGLSVDIAGLTSALTVLAGYIFFEAKADIKRILAGFGSASKIKDPKFWLALIVGLLTFFNQAFGWNLPIDSINMILGTVLALLFGWLFKKHLA